MSTSRTKNWTKKRGLTTPDRSLDAVPTTEAVERHCGPAVNHLSAYRLTNRPPGSSNRSVEEEPPTPAPVGFSDQALAIAGIIDVLPLMRHLSVLEIEVAKAEESASLHLMQVRQQRLEVHRQLSNRLRLALFEVFNTAAKVHCEEERANLSADRLQELQDNRVVLDTILAILGGATVGVVAGGLDLGASPKGAAIADIAGGTVQATFGFNALFEGGSANDHHSVDLLGEVWEGPEQSSRFPKAVWRFLNRPLPDDTAGRSVRKLLLIRWRQNGWLGEPGSETASRRKTLFFEQGGTYGLEDFRAKAGMLNLLESDIMLMAQDIQVLLHEMVFRKRVRPNSNLPMSLSTP